MSNHFGILRYLSLVILAFCEIRLWSFWHFAIFVSGHFGILFCCVTNDKHGLLKCQIVFDCDNHYLLA
jgi:hypothetical protein